MMVALPPIPSPLVPAACSRDRKEPKEGEPQGHHTKAGETGRGTVASCPRLFRLLLNHFMYTTTEVSLIT